MASSNRNSGAQAPSWYAFTDESTPAAPPPRPRRNTHQEGRPPRPPEQRRSPPPPPPPRSARKPIATVRIPAWYLEDSHKDRRKDAAPVEAEGRVRLGKHYVHSVRRFELYDIEITEVKKYAGHYFNPTLVRGVVDLSNNSLTKFYIAESDVPELEALIRSGGRKDDYLVGGKNPEWYKNL